MGGIFSRKQKGSKKSQSKDQLNVEPTPDEAPTHSLNEVPTEVEVSGAKRQIEPINEETDRTSDRQLLERNMRACMLLSGVGDALGYNDGRWEFCRSGATIHSELQKLGGLSKLRPTSAYMRVSDDTVMHMATADALLSSYMSTPAEQLYCEIARKYKECMLDMEGRAPGLTCMASTDALNPDDAFQGCVIPFNKRGGGCGAAMRAVPIGLLYWHPEEIDNLVRVSVEAGRMTHNHPTGFLGSVAVAVFVSYAVQGKEVREWGEGLLQTVQLAKKYCEQQKRDWNQIQENWSYFEDQWRKYLSETGLLTNQEETIENPTEVRSKKFFDITPKEYDEFVRGVSYAGTGGASGHDAPMIAYDAILRCYQLPDAVSRWESVCRYGMFHGGDSDSTGIIAAACYGALFGLEGVPENNYSQIEYRERLEKLGSDLFNASNVLASSSKSGIGITNTDDIPIQESSKEKIVESNEPLLPEDNITSELRKESADKIDASDGRDLETQEFSQHPDPCENAPCPEQDTSVQDAPPSTMDTALKSPPEEHSDLPEQSNLPETETNIDKPDSDKDGASIDDTVTKSTPEELPNLPATETSTNQTEPDNEGAMIDDTASKSTPEEEHQKLPETPETVTSLDKPDSGRDGAIMGDTTSKPSPEEHINLAETEISPEITGEDKDGAPVDENPTEEQPNLPETPETEKNAVKTDAERDEATMDDLTSKPQTEEHSKLPETPETETIAVKADSEGDITPVDENVSKPPTEEHLDLPEAPETETSLDKSDPDRDGATMDDTVTKSPQDELTSHADTDVSTEITGEDRSGAPIDDNAIKSPSGEQPILDTMTTTDSSDPDKDGATMDDDASKSPPEELSKLPDTEISPDVADSHKDGALKDVEAPNTTPETTHDPEQ